MTANPCRDLQKTSRETISLPAAVIFDMDGVVTDTAEAHAKAWKRLFDAFLEARAEQSGGDFEPFDPESDYRTYVDGKPRYDGVKSFLDARGIDLPFGEPEDPPDRATVCGLGNRKNQYFHEWLAENPVKTYPSSVKLARDLRAAGIKTAVFTSSRNGEAVLESAGLKELFDTRVDGKDLARLGIPGKPDPAMLCEAASRLGATPQETAVVEDAISGVEAGARGRFGLVIGIDRGDYGEALAGHGADLVVRDLGELDFEHQDGFKLKTLKTLMPVREVKAKLRERLGGRTVAAFLDYDGTLTPIVEDHTQAFLAEDMRESVAGLAQRCTVGIISGRDLADLKDLVGLDRLVYAGSHGFDIEAPGRGRETLQKGKEFLPDLDAAEKALRDALQDIEGHAVERKRFAIAVHYRRVAGQDVGAVEDAVDEVIAQHDNLRKGHGKKVFQVQPRIDWNKGKAVRWLLERLELDRPDVLPVYVGDDITDEDAFRALSGWGLGIAVGDEDRRTAADFSLASPDEVQDFLHFLTSAIDETP
jgi:alpha,alpha-trehalase